ncbi:MAG TPA: DUF2723 domain-containing protein [Anaerolineales bacterium]|nr:DUF2723 domain-containing protein [Anaerolineales bacterium]
MKRSDVAVACLLFVTSLALYVRTLAPSLLYGDSAEFQTIAYTLGLGHPTGYPVYVLLAKSFILIPVGDVAYRVNLFSAFCAALTIAFVYLSTRKLGAMAPTAIYGSLALALTPIFWKHASIAEIYTPSAACLAFILFAVLHWKETNNPRWVFVAGLLGGLSLGIHTTVALGGISILVYLALSNRQRAVWLQALLGAIVGALIFLSAFFFLDTLNSPAGYYNTVVYPSLSVWDMTPADFDSPFERLAFLYFPPQFKGQLFNVPLEEAVTRWKDFVSDVSWNLLLALLGFISLLVPRQDVSSRWREAMLLILAFITFLVFAATYNVYDYHVYYIPAGVILAVFFGLGVNGVVEFFASSPKLPRFTPLGLSIAFLVLGFYPFIGVVSSHWNKRIPAGLEDWEGYFYSFPDGRRLEAEEIVNRLEDDAIVFTDWDYAYGYYYVAHVIQGHTGMSFHETFPQEGVARFADSALTYIEANINSRPIYFSERPSQLANKFKITVAGSGLFRIVSK